MHKEAWQRVYVGVRHMHREHLFFCNPTCAVRAPFVEHTLQPCFYLCRGNAGVAQPPGDRRRQPQRFDETTTTNTMHTCVMTLAYLRGEFFDCSSFCLFF